MGRASGPDSPTVEQWRTETGLVLGTAAYMAPEQIAGRDVDARADLFAFGCVLAEMLAGRHPFRADTPLHVSARILRDPPDLDGVAEPERPLVTRALEKDPGRRFQSARDALDALARVVEAARQETITVRSPRRLIGAAAVLLLAAAAVVLWIRVPGAARDRLDSIAVLPLVNLSGDPAQEFFADGMTEAVIADLAQVASLKVISRTSVMQYKDTSKPLPQIARELGVAGIIEGSMRRSGDRVRVTAKLIHGSTEQHLWSRSYERELEDVLSLQSEVARAIAHEVRAAVTPAEAERLQQRARVNPEAFELYLRGRFEWNRRTRTSLLHAVELFEKAVETDPSYAQAWAGLADANAMLANSVYVPPDAAYGRALAAATRARELAPDLAEAHAAHGFLLFSHRHEWESAGESLRRAVALNPGYASAHQWLGAWTFLTNRRQETLAYLERAVALDPLAPRIRTVYGMYLFFLGQEDAALEQLQTAAPDDVQAHQFLADLHVRRGRLERAFLHARQVAADRRDGQLAAVHAAAGDRAEAERLLRETPPENLPPILRARVHVGLGRAESALNALLEAPTAVFLPYALGHPELAPVRQHPRFREFLRAVRLDRYYPE